LMLASFRYVSPNEPRRDPAPLQSRATPSRAPFFRDGGDS
jgi:hypothetical protein